MQYGFLNESSGEWSGMVRDLIEGKADMTASLLVTTVTSQKRMKFYYFFPKK